MGVLLLLLLAGTAPSSSKGKTLSMPVRFVCGGVENEGAHKVKVKRKQRNA